MSASEDTPSLLDVVAPSANVPARGSAGGRVGTIVEQRDDDTLLEAFGSDHCRPVAARPCARANRLGLHDGPWRAEPAPRVVFRRGDDLRAAGR